MKGFYYIKGQENKDIEQAKVNTVKQRSHILTLSKKITAMNLGIMERSREKCCIFLSPFLLFPHHHLKFQISAWFNHSKEYDTAIFLGWLVFLSVTQKNVRAKHVCKKLFSRYKCNNPVGGKKKKKRKQGSKRLLNN